MHDSGVALDAPELLPQASGATLSGINPMRCLKLALGLLLCPLALYAQDRWVVCNANAFVTCATGFGQVPYLAPGTGPWQVWLWASDNFNLGDYGGDSLATWNQLSGPSIGPSSGPPPPFTTTPEPVTLVLLGSGMVLVGVWRRFVG